MRLYREDGHGFSFKDEEKIGRGSFGEVYKLPNDLCYKIFIPSILRKSTYAGFDENIFKILKELNLKNFYKLYEIFYNRTLTRILGYSSKYYEKEDIDILTMPTDYTLNNLYNMYETAQKLAKFGIIMVDTHEENVIMRSKEITIIDADRYFQTIKKDEDGDTLKSNTYTVLSLFNTLYHEALYKHRDENFERYKDRIGDLFFPGGKDLVDNTCKKLIKYKYPIDYLRKK